MRNPIAYALHPTSLRQSPKCGRPDRKINESWNPVCLPIQSDSSWRAACLNLLLKLGQNIPDVNRPFNRRARRAGIGRANSQDSKIRYFSGWSIWTAGFRALCLRLPTPRPEISNLKP